MFNVVFKSSRSLTIELENKDIYYAKEAFDCVVDGKVVLSKVKTNVFSLYSLKPNTEYKLTILGKTKSIKTDSESAYLNVLDFGAKADGKADDTMCIQSALYACPKGGVVSIPKGTYWVRPLFLVSDVNIELQKGAILLGETDRNKYPILPARIEKSDGTLLELSSWEGNPLPTYASTITGICTKNVKIFGEGIIDENAHNSDWWDDCKTMRGAWRPKGVFLSNCENISLQGITVCNTPSWNLHPYFSSYLNFIDLKIISPKESPNTDGCDPESCDHLNVIGVDFSVGDDCIAIKSGKYDMGMKYRRPTSNMVVRNCMMAFGHGAVVLGSEMSGGVRDLTVTQCYFKQTDRGLRIKTRRGRGESAIIDGIVFENIYMEDVLSPFVINMYYNCCDPDRFSEYVWSKEVNPVDERTPYIGKFTFRDIEIKNAHVAAGFFYGLPERPIESISLENVSITYSKNPIEGVPAMMSYLDPMTLHGLEFRYVNNVVLKNVNIEKTKHQSVVLENVKNFKEDK